MTSSQAKLRIMKTHLCLTRFLHVATIGLAHFAALAAEPPGQDVTLETDLVRLQVSPENGRYQILG